MSTCPDCSTPISEGDRFCEECGRNLLVRRTPVGGPDGSIAAACVCGSVSIDAEGFCERCGRAQPSGRERMEFVLPPVAGISDVGRRRQRNEDSMAFGVVADHGVVAVVCDGVASSERAEQASQAAADAAAEVLLDAAVDGRDAERATVDAVAEASVVVAQLAGGEPQEVAPSCTFVSAVITDETATIGWVGDSRAYWLAGNGSRTPSRRLTKDDTWAAQLVDDGVITEAEAKTDHRAHVLSRWLGADAGLVVPHVVTVHPEESGLFLLCSDGLWNYLQEVEDLAAVMPTDVPPVAVAGALTKVALESGGHDNITVVVVPFPPRERGAGER
jgi:serine/threonine protein phosphatase PrpC